MTGKSKNLYFSFNEERDPVLQTQLENTVVVNSGVNNPASVKSSLAGQTERIKALAAGENYTSDSVPDTKLTQQQYTNTAIRIMYCARLADGAFVTVAPVGASTGCECGRGYTGDGFVCTDINECTDATHNCAKRIATCANTKGSFSCTCNAGWAGTGVVCTDVDECALLH